MTKHPLAVVSLLAFITGAAAAGILNYPPRRPAVAQAAAETEAAEVHPDRGAVAVEGVTREDEADSPAREAPAPAPGTKGRAPTSRRAVEGSGANRRYVRVPRAQASTGGGGVAAYTVGGVKKTGQGVKKAGTAIGKTFGKIGGVFQD